jgi:transcriptional regulator with PAS, ATPase and Fis domain
MTNFGIIGTSEPMRRAIERVAQVAPTDLTVLITGESGTGKEVFAQAIHHASPRRKHRMVSVNCGAIPETLLEAELFGNEKGAFTGAVEQRKGFFEAADKGTIFLDELGEMPLGTQVKLLRVLETGEFSRVGSPDVLRVNVRVIAATNRRLEEEVAQGNFRRDLFYRLNAVQIVLPPLREHPEDIPTLVEFFAHRTAQKLGILYEGISDDALRVLMNLPWLGNIRELRNMVETLVTLEKGKRITLEMLRPYMPLALPASREESMGFDDENSAESNVHTTDTDEPVQPVEQPDEVYLDSNATRALVHLPGKTSEQVEREMMYKALMNMAHELAGLREEISQLKDAVYRQQHQSSSTNASHSPSSIVAAERSTQQDSTTFLPVLPSQLDNPMVFDAPSLRLEDVEQRLIITALERSGGNRRLAAEQLGISERTLYRKLHEYQLLERFP